MESLLVNVSDVRASLDGETNKTFIEYHVECHDKRSGRALASAWRRFREFDELRRTLRAAGCSKLRLPPKNGMKGAPDVQKRKDGLETALREYIKSEGTVSGVLKEWLGWFSDSADLRSRGSGGGKTAAPELGKLSDAIALVRAHSAFTMETVVAKEATSDLCKRLCVTGVLMKIILVAAYLKKRGRDAGLLCLGLCLGLVVGVPSWSWPFRGGWRSVVARAALKLTGDDAPKSDISSLSEKELLARVASMLSSRATVARLSSQKHLPQTDETCATASPESDPVSSKPLDATFLAKLDRCYELLKLNLMDDVNCGGKPWTSKVANDRISVLMSEIPNDPKGRKMFKARSTIKTRLSAKELQFAIVDWTQRTKWDSTFSTAGYVQRFSGDTWVHRYCTKAQAGVSARESVDLGAVRSIDDSGFMMVSESVTPEQLPGVVPPPTKGMVRGHTHPGTGVRVCRVAPAADSPPGEHTWVMETVGNVDIKGWIPVGVMNLAMGIVLEQAAKECAAYFADSKNTENIQEAVQAARWDFL